MRTSRIWRLYVEGDRYCGFIPHDLRFFRDRFRCQPLADSWHAPPATVHHPSKPAPDFAIWTAAAPVISEDVVAAIEPLVSGEVEFLRFRKMKQVQYYALNVLRCENCLDVARSTLAPLDERFFFDPRALDTEALIFKVPDRWNEIFVTDAFGRMLAEHGFSGAALAYPEEPIFPFVRAGKSANRYPGITP